MGKKKKKKDKKKEEAAAEGGSEDAPKDDAGAAAPPPTPAPEGGEEKVEGAEAAPPPVDMAEKKEEAPSEPEKHEKSGSGNPGGRIPPLHNYTLDLTCLTPDEENIIRDVLARDEMESKPIKDHVQLLKNELDIIHRGFKKKPGDKPQCINCRKKFGLWRYLFPLLYLGKRCQRCRHKTCKRCIYKQANGRYMCATCVRLREIKFLTGEWMAPPATRLHSSDLLRVSLRDKEKYQALHASREKKKLELLTKLNALHGKGGDEVVDNNLAMWSPKEAKKKKDKKGKKDKKKKGKKKKKKKNKAANNAIPSPDSVDLNASFLEAARIAQSIAEEESKASSRAKVSRSYSSSTVDSSSDSEDSGDSGGGGFSSGYESCEQRAAGVQGQGRGERPRSVDATGESEKGSVKSAGDGDFNNLRDGTEARRDFLKGEDVSNRGEDKLKGRYYFEEKAGGRRGSLNLRDGMFVEEKNNYIKKEEQAEDRTPRRVKYEQDLITKNEQRAHPQASLGGKGKCGRNVVTDNLLFDSVQENLNPARADKDGFTKRDARPHSSKDMHCETRRKPIQVEAFLRREQTRRKPVMVETKRDIYPSSSHAFAMGSFEEHNESMALRESGDDWAFHKPLLVDRTGGFSRTRNRSSSRSGGRCRPWGVLEEERVKRKESAERELSEHTYVVTSPTKPRDLARPLNLQGRGGKDSVGFKRRSRSRDTEKEMASPQIDKYQSVKTGAFKGTNQDALERHRKKNDLERNLDKHSTPKSLHELHMRQGGMTKERVLNDRTTKNRREKGKLNPPTADPHKQRFDATFHAGQKLSAPDLELFDMAEINATGTEGDFVLSRANLEQHNAAAASTMPRAFCLGRPDCAHLNRNKRASTRAGGSGVKTGLNQQGAQRQQESSPSKAGISNACKASGFQSFPVQKNKSPKSFLRGRLKKSLVDALDIPDY